MRRAAGLALLAATLTACGFGGGGGGGSTSTPPPPASPPASTGPGATTPAPQPQGAPTTTDVSVPDAVGRLAASFTAQLLSRQNKQVGLGPLACRDLAGSAGCIQLISGGGACSSRFKAGVIKDRPDEFLATCIAGDNSWHCDVDLQYFVEGDKAGQAAYQDTCPAPDAKSADQLRAMLQVAQDWEVDPSGANGGAGTAPPTSTAS